jgi:hypothetical protein
MFTYTKQRQYVYATLSSGGTEYTRQLRYSTIPFLSPVTDVTLCGTLSLFPEQSVIF